MPWAVGPVGPRASGGLDSHLSEVKQLLVRLAGPPEPVLGFGLVARLGVAVEGRHVASVGETEGSDGFLVGHLVLWVGDWSPRASALSGFGFGLHRREDFDGLLGEGEVFATLRIATCGDVRSDASDGLGEDDGVDGFGGGVHVFCLVQLGMC